MLVVLSGGGTAGHINPALALADVLKERGCDVRFAGTIASTAPSVAHQVALDIDPQAASCWVLEPPAYKLHVWVGEGPLVSHLAYVDAYEGPYPFHEDGQLID